MALDTLLKKFASGGVPSSILAFPPNPTLIKLTRQGSPQRRQGHRLQAGQIEPRSCSAPWLNRSWMITVRK